MRETTSVERDRALDRLRRVTVLALAAAGALVAAFAGLAAKALPGHHTVKTTQTRVRVASAPQQPATPPPLVSAQSAATPTPPASPPSQTSSPPVVVSGGT